MFQPLSNSAEKGWRQCCWRVAPSLCHPRDSDHSGTPPALAALNESIDLLEVHVTFDRRCTDPTPPLTFTELAMVTKQTGLLPRCASPTRTRLLRSANQDPIYQEPQPGA